MKIVAQLNMIAGIVAVGMTPEILKGVYDLAFNGKKLKLMKLLEPFTIFIVVSLVVIESMIAYPFF